MASTLTVFTGPMFSRKSKRLIDALDHEAHADKTILFLKPITDDRTDGISYRKETLRASRPEEEPVYEKFEAHAIRSPGDAEKLFQKYKPQVIGIDEAQFLTLETFDWILKKLEENKDRDFQIFVAGLDTDYMRRPYTPVPELLAVADKVIKLEAKCDTCKGKNGSGILTQRISGTRKLVEIGSKNYRAACRVCHTIPELE